MPEKREKAARVGAGRILLWIWNHRETIPLGKIGDLFAIVLVWFLHAEGLEEFIWDWIILEAQNLKSLGIFVRGGAGGGGGRVGGSHPSLIWCHNLLAGLVRADFSWSADGSSDAAILRFLRAVEHFGPQSRLPKTVGLVTSGVCVEKIAISSHGRHMCDVTLFERLFAEVHNWQPFHPKRVIAQANLLLYHPTKANGSSWFDVIYDRYNGPNRLGKYPLRNMEKRISWGKNTLRAAQILDIKGEESKAAYLDNIFQRHFSDVRPELDKTSDGFKDDVRLQRFMQDL
ncbi:hypothetical protein KC356_g7035 [Hortaea werneckii]|nr:hypothetical protein KC356_g7035 [Hortaea werneckii]